MWIEKLSLGVLRITTPMGSRFIKPSIFQRLYLLWIFRHFPMLPVQVLNARQQKFINAICSQRHFLSFPQDGPFEDAPILGTLELRPRLDADGLPASRSAATVADVGALVEGARQRS
jgi:hypothetical protein